VSEILLWQIFFPWNTWRVSGASLSGRWRCFCQDWWWNENTCRLQCHLQKLVHRTTVHFPYSIGSAPDLCL